MRLRLVPNMTVGAALLLISVPVQASVLAETSQPAPCSTCTAERGPEPVVVQAQDGTWRVAALSKAPRSYTRFDVEGLRLLTRMR